MMRVRSAPANPRSIGIRAPDVDRERTFTALDRSRSSIAASRSTSSVIRFDQRS
jgi:hypothetical protein